MVDYLKLADKIFVPSKFCQKAFLTRGINVKVIPLGYNEEEFYYKRKKDDGVFTFTMYNAFDLRKGWDILFNAFNEEFKKDEKVNLMHIAICRLLEPYGFYEFDFFDEQNRRYSDLSHGEKTLFGQLLNIYYNSKKSNNDIQIHFSTSFISRSFSM